MLDISTFSAAEIYSLARTRKRYGGPDRIETYANNAWFCEVPYKHLAGARPRWRWDHLPTPEEQKNLQFAREFMREFCSMSDEEVENLLVSRSTLDATKYSVSVKGERLCPTVEATFLERCKGKKSRMNAMLSYCGKWDIMPENMTEITLVAGFDGGRRARIGKDFLKKLESNKRRCKELLTQIMKLEGISEEEPISQIMARLG
jgi:hypothetical protein